MSCASSSHITHPVKLKLSIRYALLAWIGEILRKEPEVRSILVALTVTLVCMFSSSSSVFTSFLFFPFLDATEYCYYHLLIFIQKKTSAMRQFHFVFGERQIVRGILLDSRCRLLGQPEVLFQCWGSNFTSGGKDFVTKLPG